MNMQRRDMGDVTVLALDGIVDGGAESRALVATVTEILGEGRRKLILDLGEVSWVNSSGLGALHRCWSLARELQGSFKLTNVNSRVRQVLAVSHFDALFESYPDVRGAVASFYR
jgi:anti-sigma B factor antagonist